VSACTITDLNAKALSSAIHTGQFSCREVMLAYLARIGTINSKVNALVSLQDPDELMRQADVRDAQLARGESMGWMHGMPQAIKDIAPVKGMRTTLGAQVLRDHVPREDGLMVQRMRAAGCIIVGRSNTPEFGLGSHTFNEVFGATRNAYDPGKSAGGSSGGAAVALALRMLPVADGSDFMGSLRNPAGWNNVFGLRPSQGRVPQWPASDVWLGQLGTEGPMARCALDLALLLNTQCGPDPRAPLSLAGKPDFTGLEPMPPRGLRIGWLADLDGYLPMESGILALCEQALRRFEALGCVVEPAAFGSAPEALWRAWLVWRSVLVAGRIALHLSGKPENRALIKPEALWEHDQATKIGGHDLIRAGAQRSAHYQDMLTLFERFDFLALPTAQVWPFDLRQRWPGQINGRSMDTYHRWMEVTLYATLAGLPCISLPAGFGEAGLPMGLQIIGRPQDEASLLRLARVWEDAAKDILARRPPMSFPA
jgi:amidase